MRSSSGSNPRHRISLAFAGKEIRRDAESLRSSSYHRRHEQWYANTQQRKAEVAEASKADARARVFLGCGATRRSQRPRHVCFVPANKQLIAAASCCLMRFDSSKGTKGSCTIAHLARYEWQGAECRVYQIQGTRESPCASVLPGGSSAGLQL